VTYELWSKTSRSIVGAFATEDAAFAAVRDAVETHGRSYAEGLAVIREDRRGRSKAVAEGSALVDRALARVQRSRQIPA
jgi:hypothetical protein